MLVWYEESSFVTSEFLRASPWIIVLIILPTVAAFKTNIKYQQYSRYHNYQMPLGYTVIFINCGIPCL
jgi:hypothetical protein